MVSVALIGHSHVLSPMVGSRIWQPRNDYIFIDILEFCREVGADEWKSMSPDAAPHFLDPLAAELRKRLQDAKVTHIVSMMGGNSHAVMGMVDRNPPFDFVVPGLEALGIRKDAQLLSYSYVKRALYQFAIGHIRQLGCLPRLGDYRVYHFEPPPPIADSDFVTARLDPALRARYPDSRAAPKELRYKLWILTRNLYQELCTAWNIGLITVPASVLDADGYLETGYRQGDATHGNQLYGVEVLKQIDAAIAGEAGPS